MSKALGSHEYLRPLFLRSAVSALLHPGPPPKGWVRLAIGMLALSIAACGFTVWLGVHLGRRPSHYFEEQKLGTLLNVAALFGCAWVCRSMGVRLRGRAFGPFWLIHFILFLYLGLDDLFRIHERIDNGFHRLAGLDRNNPITDHLDDAIVIAYAVFAACVWLRYRFEVLRFPWMLWTMIAGFLGFAAMTVLDVREGQKVLEESLKLVSSTLILLAFLAARMTRETEDDGNADPR